MTQVQSDRTNRDTLSCAVYVDAPASAGALVRSLVGWIGGSWDEGTISHNAAEIDVRKNDEFDELRRREFPDGFLYFRFRLEVYAGPQTGPDVLIQLTARLLEKLWAQKWPAVAACGFEDRLPEGGGYKSRSVPWVATAGE